MAAVRGREFVLPDDVKLLVPPVLAHRLIVRPESRLRKVTAAQIVEEILDRVPVPVVATGAAS
jgi:MoxR-like ATPase